MRTRYIWRKAGSVSEVVQANDTVDVIKGGLFTFLLIKVEIFLRQFP
jgi:hypothetical protein